MLTIRAMSVGRKYAARHLEHSDYYAEGERVTGQWYGRAAEMLGLRGSVDSADFEALREGLHPRRASSCAFGTAPTAPPLTGKGWRKGVAFTT